MLNFVDHYLDRFSMYKLTVYYLSGILITAAIFGFFHLISYSPLEIAVTTAAALAVCMIGNEVMAHFMHATTNSDSATITALILTLLIAPALPRSLILVAFAGGIAMASKYLATIAKHHVFNPVAAGAVALSLLTNYSAVWWVGSPFLLPFVALGGWLVIRKAQREDMAFTFLAATMLATTVVTLWKQPSLAHLLTTWRVSVLDSALVFFATIMLTEPITSPGTKWGRRWFAIVTSFFYLTPQLPLFGTVFTPEEALCISNFLFFLAYPQYRFVFTLVAQKMISKDTYEFVFSGSRDLHFEPGQYMEWTLPHKPVDNRGNRRYFSLSSAPSEGNVAFAIRYYDPPSSYKKTLLTLTPGAEIIASNVAGDFTLPSDLSHPLVFVAGGIGVAPFRSMLRAIIDAKVRVDLTILYVNRHTDEIAYNDLFVQAAALGVKTYYVLTDAAAVPPGWKGAVGHVDANMVKQLVPHWDTASYYISGPQPMVAGTREVLSRLGLPHRQIITDFFPGYVM